MSLVGYSRIVSGGKCGSPVLLLAGQTLFNIFYLVALYLCFLVYTFPSKNDIALLIYSYKLNETNMMTIFMTFCSTFWRQFTIAPFIILLMSLAVLAFINIMIEEEVLYHYEHCLYRGKTKKRCRSANTM